MEKNPLRNPLHLSQRDSKNMFYNIFFMLFAAFWSKKLQSLQKHAIFASCFSWY